MDMNTATSPKKGSEVPEPIGSPGLDGFGAEDAKIMEDPTILTMMGSPSQIGKLTDDWSMELSPIAQTRDSLGAKAIGLASVEATTNNASPLVPKATATVIEAEQSENEQPVLTDDVLVEPEKPLGPSWYLGSEATTPVSNTASDEFSLESLDSDNNDEGKISGEKMSGKGQVGTGDGPQAQDEAPGFGGGPGASDEVEPKNESTEKQKEELAEQLVNDLENDPAESATTPVENEHRESEDKAEREFEEAEAEEKSPWKSLLPEQTSEKRTTTEKLCDDLTTDESPKTDHTSSGSDDDGDDGDDEEEDRTSPDADALLKDATEQVKKFVYEMNILNASQEDSGTYTSESSTLSKSSDFVSIKDDIVQTEDKEKLLDNDHDDDKNDGVLGGGESSVRMSDAGEDRTCQEEEHVPDSIKSPEKCHSIEKLVENKNVESEQDGVTRLSDSPILSNGAAGETRVWQTPPRRSSINQSFGTPGTPRTPGGNHDYTDARNDVGSNSQQFHQLLRGAAQKRKQNLARSRDSLVAKEREQRETVAALKEASKHFIPPTSTVQNTSKGIIRKQKANTFKAKPLPATNGELGHGGMKGIPKVAKKPTTIPSSPLLGARRLNPPAVKSLQAPVTKPRTIDMGDSAVPKVKRIHFAPATTGTFKARPLPPTTGNLGRSGQFGVPKVPKRPVTVPSSPCLGPRRRHSSVVSGKENPQQSRRISTGMVKSTPSSKVSVSKTSAKVSILQWLCAYFVVAYVFGSQLLTGIFLFLLSFYHQRSLWRLSVKLVLLYLVLTF